jgi:hypothetical protein
MLMHESNILRQLRQHRCHKHLLNVIATLEQTTCTFYIDSIKLTLQTGLEIFLQTLCKFQIKRLGSVISAAKI